MAKNSKKQSFIAAVKARGGLKHYDLGGTVNPATSPFNSANVAGTSGNGSLAVNPLGTIAAGNGPAIGGTNVNGGPGGAQSAGGLIGSMTPQSQYSAQLAPTTQLNYTPGIDLGLSTTQANLGAQQGLEQTFLNEGMGQGPNPAQQQLAANTGTNIANQAALAASQRGSSSNVGLMQRNIAQQGASTQQQAVGQSGVLQAQQQLAAQQAAAQQQASIASGAANLYGTSIGANNAQNSNQVANYGQMQGVNAATSMGNAQTTSSMIGGLMGGGGSALSALMAEGGEVPDLDSTPAPASNLSGPSSFAGRFLSQPTPPKQSSGKSGGGGGMAMLAMLNHGGKVPAMVSPEEVVLSKKEMQSPNAPAIAADKVKKGDKVPGKAKVPGDSLKNDTQPRLLEAGGAVVKRTAAQDPSKAAQFVQHIKSKQGMKRKGKN